MSKAHAAHGLPTATVVEGDYIATAHAAWDLPFAPTVMPTTDSGNADESQVIMTNEPLTRDVEALEGRCPPLAGGQSALHASRPRPERGRGWTRLLTPAIKEIAPGTHVYPF